MARGRQLTDPWLATETKFTAEGAAKDLETRLVGLTVLWHTDLDRIGERVELAGLGSGRREPLARHTPLFARPGSSIARPLADDHLSRRPIVLESDGEGVSIDASATRTPVEVDGEPLAGLLRFDAEALESGKVLLLGRRVVLLLHRFDPLAVADSPGLGMVGSSDAMVEMRRAITQVADLDIAVLLRGESGTGKELAAAAVHRLSRRRHGAFVVVNMAAVPPSLAASELFGAAKGAYTGADVPRRGFFRQADGGTLFLDEIGETPAEVQPLLLRALESGEVQAVGANRPEKVDVRVIAATDADLESASAAGEFRLPLLHRLAAYTVHLPPLARRRDDFGRLLRHFLEVEMAAAKSTDRGLGWLQAAWVAELALRSWRTLPGQLRRASSATHAARSQPRPRS
ncbi:MAG: sigma-54 factor interaction domain-containing protein, partial [Acidobacteriota bacterium]